MEVKIYSKLQPISVISRPPLISYKEFKYKLADCDGYGKGRRIIFFGHPEGEESYKWKYRIPFVGKKEQCYKEAYRLLFLERNEDHRTEYIQEGAFKFPLAFNFSIALWLV